MSLVLAGQLTWADGHLLGEEKEMAQKGRQGWELRRDF